MPFPDGTPLSDIFRDFLPTALRKLLEPFTVDGVTSAPFAGGTQHSGTFKSLRDAPLDLGFGELQLPGVGAGISFRLAEFDTPDGRWHLDLVLNGFHLKLRDLHGADALAANGTTPRRLIRKVVDTAVVISGEATIRFQQAASTEPVVILFVENASATDPLANTGAVVNLRCNPPHFFFGTSQFAMTLMELLFDASSTFSPQFITNLGQTPAWMGFAIAEAAFYAPPNALGRGGFSGGVRNLLIGAPRGLQGEFEVQWGRAPLNPTTFVFTQNGQTAIGATGTGNALTVPITAGHGDRVQMAVGFTAAAPPEGGGAVTDWKATWRWPDGSETTGDTATSQVGHGQILRVIPEEHITARPVLRHPEITFRFVAAGEVPEIDVISAGTSVVNTVHAAGPAADIAALAYRARSTAPVTGTFSWKLGANGAVQTGVGITIPLAEITGDQDLILKETSASGAVRMARLRVQVMTGPLLIGGEDGVVLATAPTAPITPAAVEGTYDLPDFHAEGRYRPAPASATLAPAAPERVDVPDGALAVVTIPSGGAPPVVAHDRHVEILFEFATGQALRWGAAPPAAVTSAGSEADLHRQVLAWAANYPGADFLVVGRCDDLGSASLNATLAHSRRDTALQFLKTRPAGSALVPVVATRITGWGEQDGQPTTVASTPLNDEEKANQRLILATDDTTSADLTNRTGWPTTRDTSHASEAVRAGFRRVDIYAVGGTPATAAVSQELSPGRAPDLRRMLMPGETADPVPAETSTPASDYRIRLLVAWDKPTGEGWADLIPSKAEFEFAWSPSDDPLPSLAGQPVDMGTEVLTVYGSWRHDDATGFTRSQLGIRSDGDPEGLIKITQPNLVATLALGPVLLSGVNSQTDTIEKAGRIAALAGAAAFASVDLGGGPLVGAGSKAVIKSIEATAEFQDIAAPGEGYKVSLTSEYTTTLHVNTGKLGLSTDPDNPVIFRYKNVGIQLDTSKTDIWDKIGVAYPTDALQIENPGKWKIDGVLGELLRAVETALGTGSLWVETRFAFALTIGVIEISEAVIRVTFTGATPIPDFSLRGLVARIDVPATIKGEGRLRIEDPGGVIRAGLDVSVVPLKLSASAAFAMASFTTPEPFTFVSLFLKVQFPVGIPLGPSGLALHGLIGQTAINGKRAVSNSTDVVKREIGWWNLAPENKYNPFKGQHAFGVGAVVGTLPDASFSLSATGMIVVAFPDPEVIFGVEVKLLSIPSLTAKEQGGDMNAGILGLIVINSTGVSIAVSARFEIPKILLLQAPISARFPSNGRGNYVRIGSDGQMGRSGEPVTLTLLPSTLNLKAYSYLMIEQDGLQNLGGNPEFSFEGFSVGFGAGAALEWKAGPFKLSASVQLLAGFGTDPLMIKAGIFVKGELDLVVVSVAANGEIKLTYFNDNVWMDGEFCGRVDFFFFTVKGCVKFRIGNSTTASNAEPPHPVASLVLTDRGGRIMGEAKRTTGSTLPPLQGRPLFEMTKVNGQDKNTAGPPSDNNVVWPDTAPVLNFRHYIKDAVPAGGQFVKKDAPTGEIWFGSNRLKFTYRLDDVRLVRASDGQLVAGLQPLQRAWITSPARQMTTAGSPQPSGAEVTGLRLLDWLPFPWALPRSDGGAGTPGNPAMTIGDLCTPLQQPARACLFGRDARGAGPNRIRLLHETPAPGPYPSRFTLTGRPAIRLGAGFVEGAALTSLVASNGGMVLPGAVIDLPAGVMGPTGPLAKGYRLPEAQLALLGMVTRTALPWIGTLDTTIRRGRLQLMVCDGRIRPPPREPRQCYDFEGLPIGKRFATLNVPGFRLEAIDPGKPFAIGDRVDAAQGSPTLGADTRPDISIPQPGILIHPLLPVRIVELHLYRADTGPVELGWKDVMGKTYALSDPGGAKGAFVLRLAADADIDSITTTPKGKPVFLFRICAVGAGQGQTCFDFEGVKKSDLASGQLRRNGVTFTTADPGFGLRLHDMVDASVTPAKAGTDGKPELGFPDKGLEITFDEPVTSVSLGVRSGGAPVTAVALDANGTVVAQVSDPAKKPDDLHLTGAGITRIVLSGGSNEAVLFRLCRGAQGGADGEVCADFRGQKETRAESLRLASVTLTPRNPGETLHLMDVLTSTDPAAVIPDGIPELLVPEDGLVLTPDAVATGMTLYLATPGGALIDAVAFDAAENKVATAQIEGQPDVQSQLVLTGPGITRVVLMGRDKVFLTRLCVQSGDKAGQMTDGGSLPRVVTHQGGRAVDWVPQVTATIATPGGGTCRIVSYDQPAAVIDAPDFDIVTTSGTRVALLALCAFDSRADLARDQDLLVQTGLKNDLTVLATGTLAQTMREVVLDPGQNYRIEVDWSWQRWESNEDGTDKPPPVPTGVWQTGKKEDFYFRVAAEELAATNTQDGLNEYKFDPRDVARYLSRTEPADGRDVVFTDDPLWVHFNTGHVQALVDRYARKLELRARRTDPPPQPNSAAMELAVNPVLLQVIAVKAPRSTQLVAEQLINDAVLAAPCLPGGQVAGGASLGARFQLEPNAMYDFTLVAPRKAPATPAQADPVLVNATRFVTSRYANPTEMLAGLGFGIGTPAPIAPMERILADSMVLPAGPLAVSDLDMTAALVALGMDTLPLPGDVGRVIALWRHIGAGVFGVAGLLVDAPEPLRRMRAVLQGNQAVDALRCQPERMQIGGAVFAPVRATLNWTRLLLVAPAPMTPPVEGTLQFVLQVAPGGTLTGQRRINPRPTMLDTEGF